MKIIKQNSESDLIMDLYLPNIIRGRDGETPFIGKNGNWWIGERDTGVNAAGLSQDQVEALDDMLVKDYRLAGQVAVVGGDGQLTGGGNFEEFVDGFDKIVCDCLKKKSI